MEKRNTFKMNSMRRYVAKSWDSWNIQRPTPATVQFITLNETTRPLTHVKDVRVNGSEMEERISDVDFPFGESVG